VKKFDLAQLKQPTAVINEPSDKSEDEKVLEELINQYETGTPNLTLSDLESERLF